MLSYSLLNSKIEDKTMSRVHYNEEMKLQTVKLVLKGEKSTNRESRQRIVNWNGNLNNVKRNLPKKSPQVEYRKINLFILWLRRGSSSRKSPAFTSHRAILSSIPVKNTAIWWTVSNRGTRSCRRTGNLRRTGGFWNCPTAWFYFRIFKSILHAANRKCVILIHRTVIHFILKIVTVCFG